MNSDVNEWFAEFTARSFGRGDPIGLMDIDEWYVRQKSIEEVKRELVR
jgi:hypothetical protein